MKIQLQSGSEMFFGVAKVPLSQDVVAKISEIVKAQNAIMEAYLPLVFVRGHIDEPRQVLVIVGSFGDQLQDSLLTSIHSEVSKKFFDRCIAICYR